MHKTYPLEIPIDLHKKLKRFALEKDITLKELILTKLKQEINK